MIGVLGDSISATSYVNSSGVLEPSGYYVGMVVVAAGESLAARNGAVSGARLDDTVQYLTQRYPIGCTRLIVFLGTNDAYHMGTDESGTSWQRDWDTLWAHINASIPRPQVTVLSLLPTLYGFGCPWAYDDEYLIGYMDNISRETCYRNGGIWVNLSGVRRDMIRPDNHPTPECHGLIAGEILRKWGIV